jgi:hypothetical protein
LRVAAEQQSLGVVHRPFDRGVGVEFEVMGDRQDRQHEATEARSIDLHAAGVGGGFEVGRRRLGGG